MLRNGELVGNEDKLQNGIAFQLRRARDAARTIQSCRSWQARWDRSANEDLRRAIATSIEIAEETLESVREAIPISAMMYGNARILRRAESLSPRLVQALLNGDASAVARLEASLRPRAFVGYLAPSVARRLGPRRSRFRAPRRARRATAARVTSDSGGDGPPPPSEPDSCTPSTLGGPR